MRERAGEMWESFRVEVGCSHGLKGQKLVVLVGLVELSLMRLREKLSLALEQRMLAPQDGGANSSDLIDTLY
jgi:hypothetical protein